MTLTCAVCDGPMQRVKTSAPQGIAKHRACSPEHGASGYRKGCRCDVCREGQRAKVAAYVSEVKTRDGVAPYTRYRREARGVDPYAPVLLPDCSECGEPLDRPSREGSLKPMHNRCKPGAFYVHPDIRQSVYERDEWTCTICSHPVEPAASPLSDWYPTLDHIVPQSAQLVPDHSPENLRLACRYCNLARGNRSTIDEEVARRAIERRMAAA